MTASPRFHADAEACADAILAAVGKRVVLGLPLGLGKANHIANALYARAEADPSIRLDIFTALTLEKDFAGPRLARRFIGPIAERLFDGYPELAYARALRAGSLPPNIRVSEFYLTPGRWLGVAATQQNYVSVNYGEAARLLLARGVNVIAQIVARRGDGGAAEFSLSCNPDVTLDLLDLARRAGHQIALVGQVNRELPFMPGDSVLPGPAFDHILEAQACEFPLFGPPNEPVSMTHHAMALHVARLVKDGGAIQIGIGSLSDAVAWSLILRHRHNAEFRAMVRLLAPGAEASPMEVAPFRVGLYGVTEMLGNAFVELYRAGILKRRASDSAILHAAFFLGPRGFYRALRDMSEAERAAFHMTRVLFTNEIGGPGEATKRADRRDARFINAAMMVTLLGEIVSDTREDGRVVSGVGGQYNFIAQAHQLESARAIIAINAVRSERGRDRSNIRYSYGAATVPRHLRDIVVSEYGIADLRYRSDRDVAVALINIADSRFQPELLDRAKAADKVERDYRIPDAFRDNTPARLRAALVSMRQAGLLPSYPFGSDLDPVEQRLHDALERLKQTTTTPLDRVVTFLRALTTGTAVDKVALARLGLERPRSLEERILQRFVAYALAQQGEWNTF